MSAKYSMVFRYDEEIRQALETFKERVGVSLHEQVRRAVRTWIAAQGLSPRDERHAARAARVARLTAGEVTGGNSDSESGAGSGVARVDGVSEVNHNRSDAPRMVHKT